MYFAKGLGECGELKIVAVAGPENRDALSAQAIQERHLTRAVLRVSTERFTGGRVALPLTTDEEILRGSSHLKQ
jgi:phenolic acid decarboxylase